MNEYKIKNLPDYANHYEFVVARRVGDEFWFWGAYSNGFKAEEVALTLDNAVTFHNVRIQGYQP